MVLEVEVVVALVVAVAAVVLGRLVALVLAVPQQVGLQGVRAATSHADVPHLRLTVAALRRLPPRPVAPEPACNTDAVNTTDRRRLEVRKHSKHITYCALKTAERERVHVGKRYRINKDRLLCTPARTQQMLKQK